MTTYMGYRIASTGKDFLGRNQYIVLAEHHEHDGRIHWERTAGPYPTIETAKAACRNHFGRL